MKKPKMVKGTELTFEEGCNKYLKNCRQRKLMKRPYFYIVDMNYMVFIVKKHFKICDNIFKIMLKKAE